MKHLATVMMQLIKREIVGAADADKAALRDAAVAQVVGLLALAFSGYLTLVSMAILRFSTEALMMMIRMWFTYNHHNDFKRITSVENAN